MAASRFPHNGTTRAAWRRVALLMSAAGFGWVAVTAVWPASRASAQALPAAAPVPVRAADDGRLNQAQLEQLLAPVALYPDQLLMQMLMAATYPLEVVQAQRWLQQGHNAQLRGDALTQALIAQPWDPSVKSLVPFPDVLKMMNDQLEWTQQAGDALLAQQTDVLSAVQVLRSRAQAAGTLQSGPQQIVTVNTNINVPPPAPGAPSPAVAPPQQVIVIEPTQPDTVYVPAYNPNVAYGSWPYPSYPPPYHPPPAGWGMGSALLTGMAFAGGVALVGSLWGWVSPGWGGGEVNINANRYNNINVNRSQISGNTWRHDSSHRQGTAYRNNEVRDRYRGDGSGGAAARDRAQSREQFRGRMEQADRGGALADRGGPGGRVGLGDRGGPGDRDGVGDRGGPGDRGGVGDRGGPGDRGGLADRGPAGGAQRPRAGDRPAAGDRGPAGGAQRPAASAAQQPAAAQRAAPTQRPATQQAASGRPQVQQRQAAQPQRSPPAFRGAGNGGAERAAAQRGAASRQAPAAPRAAAGRRGGGGGGAPAQAGGGARGGGGRR